MGTGATAVERLTGLVSAEDRFTYSAKELREAQIAALNERFQERVGPIKLLGHRAADAGLSEVRSLADAVPLLFPHTAYKSYPEGWLTEGKWDRMGRWLGTVSPYPIQPIEMEGIQGIDDWIERLQAKGHYVSCSSGTTGKSAMLLASQKDMDWTRKDCVNVFAWGAGVKPEQDRMRITCSAIASVPKNITVGEAQNAAFCNPAWPPFEYPVPPITVGSLTAMVFMRKAIAEGTATPDDLLAFDRISKERQDAVEAAVGIAADAAIANREKKLFLAGLWAGLYDVAKAVREKGYSAKDFHPDNCIYVGGGLKRAQLPPDYQEFVYETFNVPTDRKFQNYSMQELNSGMPKCREGGRYHVPPWVVPLILDKDGDALLPHSGSEVEGRAAFFDLSLDGRWGGVISGDKVTVDFSPCKCGSASPSIADTIVRYADIQGDDKIGCAGTVDAYVRGAA